MSAKTTAFFISRFDDASRFIFEAFTEGLHRNREELGREIELIRIDDLVASPNIVAAISSGLNNAIAAIADITPLAITGSITANDKTYDGTVGATLAGATLSGDLIMRPVAPKASAYLM